MKVNGEAIRAIRQAKGRTVRDLAAAADMDLGYLSRIENGLKGASPDMISRIAKALEVSEGAISYPAPQATPATIRRVVELLGSSAEEMELEVTASSR